MMIPWVQEYLLYLLETCCQRLCQVEDWGKSFGWGFFFLGRELFIPKGASAARSYCALGGGYMFRGGGQLGS